MGKRCIWHFALSKFNLSYFTNDHFLEILINFRTSYFRFSFLGLTFSFNTYAKWSRPFVNIYKD